MKIFSVLLAITLISPVLSATDRPNFVLIFIDDMGYGDIEPFGSTVNATPNLNRMAAEGMKLTSFYAAPVCSASRAQLLTGSYAPRVSIPGVLFPRQGMGLNPDEHTVADYLKEVGYATACVGKWHLGDQVSFLPTRQGFDSYFGIPYSNDMQKTATESGLRVTPLIRDEKVADLLEDEGQRRVTREYTEEAVKFIQSKADGEEPFFLYMPHTAMHVPLFPHQDFVGKSANGVYGDWVAEVDWSVGEILKTLDEADLSENTLVIFTSDNGPWASKGKAGGVSGPLRGSKGCTLEGGVRVPTIARWIGKIEGGTVSDAITGTTDVLPTFAALGGAELKSDRQIDGVDITDVLLGETSQSSREAWYYFGGTKLQAVRQGPWKLALTPQKIGMGFDNLGNDDIKRGGRLYNLDAEIGEMTDLAAGHPEIVAKLQGLADAMAKEITSNRRPAGQVENPVMLYLSDAPLRSERKKLPRKPPNWTKVKAGDVIDTNSAPGIAGNAFTVEAAISGENLSGPIVAHGGSAVGYVLYAKAGEIVFAISHGSKVDRVSLPVSDRDLPYIASFDKDGLTLIQGDRSVTSQGGAVGRHPQEDLCIGHDDKNPVDSQAPKGNFTGSIDRVLVKLK